MPASTLCNRAISRRSPPAYRSGSLDGVETAALSRILSYWIVARDMHPSIFGRGTDALFELTKTLCC
jgi:hypothetical protein